MKNIPLLIPILLVLTACSGSTKKADGYGTFESIEVNVTSEQQGRLISLTIDEGQTVKKGYVAAVIDTTSLSLQVMQIEEKIKALTLQKANLSMQQGIFEEQKKNMVREINRLEKLVKENAATTKQLDDARGNLNITELQISQAGIQQQATGAELSSLIKQKDLLNYNLSKCYIVCPKDGIIIDKYFEEGEIVSPGRTLFKLSDLSEMYIRAYISQTQLTSVKLGQTVTVAADDRSKGLKKYNGTVSWISQQTEFTPKVVQTKEERVNLVYAIKILIRNDGSLKSGMPGEFYFNEIK